MIKIAFTNEENPIPIEPARCLISGLAAINLQHDSSNPGVIHDGYHITNNGKKYSNYKEFKQVGCSDEKFA